MARRKARKIPPTEYSIYATLAEGSTICDIGQVMSQINRKKFRQGMQYAIQSIEIYAPSTDVIVSRLPHHWVMVNSWTKAMELWRQQQNDTAAEAGLLDTIAAHRDFKVYGDATHADGDYNVLQPITVGTGAVSDNYRTLSQGQSISATVGMDWEHSEIVIPNKTTVGNTVEYKLHVLGDDSTGGSGASVGIIHAYANSRARPQQVDPNFVDVATGGVYGEMFDVGDDNNQITTNFQNKNDFLPYLNDVDSEFEFYPGGANQGSGWTIEDVLSIQSGNRTLSSSTVGPFLANCGLLLFAVSNGTCQVKITLAPGDYKGVAARPMQDVN